MADEGTNTVSARGSFLIGLVLGLGIGCIFAIFQKQDYEKDVRLLKGEKEALMKKELDRLKSDNGAFMKQASLSKSAAEKIK